MPLVFYFLMVASLNFLIFISSASAQSPVTPHQGLSFQATIKTITGRRPSTDSASIRVQLLTPTNDCVLREELHSNIKIQEGYFSLGIGSPSGSITGPYNPTPLLTLASVFNNSAPYANLTCVDKNNNVVVSNQSYTPNEYSRRKVRLRISIPNEAQIIVADFNIRSAGFAINSETLGGKKASDFLAINAGSQVTQTNIETIFNQFTKLNSVLTGLNGSGDLPINKITLSDGTTPFLNNDGATFLAGDGTWKTVAGGGGAVASVAGRTGAVTLSSSDITDATSANTPDTLVKRDPSGNFAAGTITANSLSGTTVSATGVTTGSLQVTGGSPSVGQVLTSDASGNAAWAAPAISSQWNNGAASSINYMAGNVGIGTTAPSTTLDVNGNAILGSGRSAGWQTLTAAATASDTTITVADTTDFPSSGTLRIESELIQYTGKTATSFTGCTRGVMGTTAAAHANGTQGVAHALLMVRNDNTTHPPLNLFNDGSIAIGSNANAAGPWSIAIGADARATWPRAVAIGYSNIASAWHSVAMGNASSASGWGAVTLGAYSWSSARTALAQGDHTGATAYAETVLGAYNKSTGTEHSSSFIMENPTDPLFVVGNGVSGANSNALMLFQNGQLLLNGGTKVALPAGNATFNVMGATNDSSAAAINATDFDGNSKFYVRNDGNVGIGTGLTP